MSHLYIHQCAVSSNANQFRLEKSRSQRILWLLQELNLPYELEIFHRNKKTMMAPPELQKVHPLGKSPVIQIKPAGAAEDAEPITLAESGFITQYLAENVPGGKKLVPQRWKEGMEGKIGGETEAWMRYQYYLHYCEGTLMPPLVMALVVSGMLTFSLSLQPMITNSIYSPQVPSSSLLHPPHINNPRQPHLLSLHLPQCAY